MVTIAETPGEIIIQNTPTTTETTKGVEPNHAERILGIRMAVTTQMKTELSTYFHKLKNLLPE